MMGREAGTIWNAKATDYVASQFAKYGLRPAGDSGTYFQTVPNIRPSDASATPAPARNVIAIFPGTDPALRGEYVAITGHNDHIGYTHRPVDHDSLRAFNTVVRPLGADSPMREPSPDEWTRIRKLLDSLRALRPPRPDSIRNGADDDGSGTIALIEIAEALARGNVKPRRSILLVSHTAEEKGLRGSEWYTDHATVPIDSIVAEFDVDMIGRGAATDIKAGGPTYLEVVGLRRLSQEFGDWFEAVNAKEPTPFVFNYEYDAPGPPASSTTAAPITTATRGMASRASRCRAAVTWTITSSPMSRSTSTIRTTRGSRSWSSTAPSSLPTRSTLPN